MDRAVAFATEAAITQHLTEAQFHIDHGRELLLGHKPVLIERARAAEYLELAAKSLREAQRLLEDALHEGTDFLNKFSEAVRHGVAVVKGLADLMKSRYGVNLTTVYTVLTATLSWQRASNG